MLSSGGGAAPEPDLDAVLARLSGPKLVEYLCATCRRADYDAAKRVLADRDRRLAEAETGLAELWAEVQEIRERCLAFKAENRQSRGPGSRSSSGGAITIEDAAPRADRRAQERVPIIDLSSSDDDDKEELEGEFRPPGVAGVSCNRKEESASTGDQGRRAAVSCQRKESASEGEEERTPAGVSCKRKERASACSPDDEDDGIPLSQFFLKKRRTRAQPGANGEPKKGHGDVLANSAGLLGVDRPAISPVNRVIPQAVSAEHLVDPKAVLVQGAGNGQSGKNGGLFRTMPSPLPSGFTAGNSSRKNGSKPNGSEGQARIGEKQSPEAVVKHMVGSPDDPKGTGNGQSRKNGGLSRTMPSPPPTGSNAGNSPHKKGSKSNGSEGRARIGEKQGPVAGLKNDVPVQVRTPSIMDMVRRTVGSARVGTETPMENNDCSPDGTISMVLKSIEVQEKAIGGVHKTKVSLDTNGNGDKASVVLKDTREQGKPDDQVLHTKVLSRTDGVRGQEGKLSPCQSPVDTHGGRPTTTDKPVSATLQRKNQLVLHSEQMPVESSLPSAVTRYWKSSSDVLASCLVGDKELIMQAICALHRQKKFTTQPIAGGLTKYDSDRAAALAEFLLDGNLQGPLKRTAMDLEKHDSTAHDFVERVVLQCSEQLFNIYRNKDDKYFR